MFWNRRKYKMNMIANIRPSSKVALKMQCLAASKYDVDAAEKLYNFLAKDLEDLPTFDIVPPTTMQQIKDGAVQTFGWINQNQDTIMNWIGIIKDMFGKGGNGNAVPPAAAPIPSINQ